MGQSIERKHTLPFDAQLGGSVDAARFLTERKVPEYCSRFPDAWRLLELGGVAPGQERQVGDGLYRYAQRLGFQQGDMEYYGNIGKTAVGVAYCAEILATTILESEHADTERVVREALIHDGAKGYEIVRRKAQRAGLFQGLPYSEEAYDSVGGFLEEENVDTNIIDAMVHAGSMAGGGFILHRFVTVDDKGNPMLNPVLALGDKIVHHADDVTFSPIAQQGDKQQIYYLTFPEAMDATNFRQRYPFVYKEGFGFNAEREIVSVDNVQESHDNLTYVKSYADWQIWVAREVAADLVNRMNVQTSPEDPEKYLKDLVNARLANEHIGE